MNFYETIKNEFFKKLMCCTFDR